MAGYRGKVERLLRLANAGYLEANPGYANGYPGDKRLSRFVIDVAYDSQAIHAVLEGGTGHRDLTGYRTWKELAAYAEGLLEGIAIGKGRRDGRDS